MGNAHATRDYRRRAALPTGTIASIGSAWRRASRWRRDARRCLVNSAKTRRLAQSDALRRQLRRVGITTPAFVPERGMLIDVYVVKPGEVSFLWSAGARQTASYQQVMSRLR